MVHEPRRTGWEDLVKSFGTINTVHTVNTCDRCGGASKVRVRSHFNQHKLCRSCWQKEIEHPKYAEATTAYLEAAAPGDENFSENFPGIGLPDDLAVEKKDGGATTRSVS